MAEHTFFRTFAPVMKKVRFNKRSFIVFQRFSNKGYALFNALGREVLIGILSVSTLSHAKAEGISTRTEKADADTTLLHQEHELDEVSITATRAPLGPGRQARMVTVLSQKEIAAAPAQSINDLLKYIAGVDVRQRGPVGAQTDVGIRGGNYEQITILLNGVNINDPQTGHNAFDFPCSIADIQRIEVLEGPAARVYGTSSMLGAVNIITRRHDATGLQASVEGGSYGYLSATARAKYSDNGRWSHSLSGTYTRSDGYSRSAKGHLNMNYNGGKSFYQGSYNHADFDLRWQAGLSTKGFGSNTFYSPSSDEQYERTTKTYIALQGNNKNARLHLHPQLYWNHYTDRFELFHNNPSAYPFNHHRTDVFGAGINSWYDWSQEHRTALSAEIREEDLVSGNLGEPLDRPKHIHGTDRAYTHGINRTNIQLTLEHDILLKAFTLSMGLTAVRNSWSDAGMRFYPGIDASYRLGGNWKAYASYNASLRMPSVTELYYNSKGYNANKHLKPEELTAIEIGIVHSTPIIRAQVNVFYNRYKNLIDWIVDEKDAAQQLTTTNFGRINAVGTQADLRLDLAQLLPSQRFLKSLNTAYTYLNQDQKRYEGITSRYVLEYLRHKFVANLQAHVWRALNLNLNYRFQKRNGSYVAGVDAITGKKILNRYSPYSLLDAKLTWTATHYTLYLEAHNLTGHRYADFGRLKQPGRWIMAGISLNL